MRSQGFGARLPTYIRGVHHSNSFGSRPEIHVTETKTSQSGPTVCSVYLRYRHRGMRCRRSPTPHPESTDWLLPQQHSFLSTSFPWGSSRDTWDAPQTRLSRRAEAGDPRHPAIAANSMHIQWSSSAVGEIKQFQELFLSVCFGGLEEGVLALGPGSSQPLGEDPGVHLRAVAARELRAETVEGPEKFLVGDRVLDWDP